MSDHVTVSLVVGVPGVTVVYTGGGEWFGVCGHRGCEEWRIGFSKREAQRLIDAHRAVCECPR